jgi:hypothetical protein
MSVEIGLSRSALSSENALAERLKHTIIDESVNESPRGDQILMARGTIHRRKGVIDGGRGL